MKITYKIKERALDPKDSLIEKTGGTVEFSMNQIDKDVAYLNKALKELTAEIGVKEATKVNVERTHPHVANMTQEDLTAAYIFREATGFLHLAEQKKKQIEDQLKEYADEKAEIIKQTGIEYEQVK